MFITCELCRNPGKKISYLPCKHVLCRKCKSKWLPINPTCPFCRVHVPKNYNSKYFDLYIKNDLILIGQLKKTNKEQMIKLFSIEKQITDLLDIFEVSTDIDIPYLLSYPNSLYNIMPKRVIDDIHENHLTEYKEILTVINSTDESIFNMDEIITNMKYTLLNTYSNKIDEAATSIIHFLTYTKNPNINPVFL